MVTEYELTYVTNPQFNEEQRAELDGAVDSDIQQRSGQISHSTPNLRRRLFYPIQKNQAAFLRTVQLQLEPAQLADLRKTIKKIPGVLRLTLLRTPPRAEVSMETLLPTSPERAADAAKPTKKVTMQEVEKKIEEALQEEVK